MVSLLHRWFAPTSGHTMTAPLQLKIVCDSREQAPFRFENFPAVVTVAGLEAGDYSLAGFERRIAIERKSLDDLLHSISTERPRFERELARLRGFDSAAVVCESPAAALRSGNYRAKLNPEAGWQSVLAFSMRYRIAFIFCDSRADAERTVFDFLRHFARDRWRELQALRLAPTMPPERTRRPRPGAGPSGDGDAPEGRTQAGTEPAPTVCRTVSRVLPREHGSFSSTGAQSVAASPAVLSRVKESNCPCNL
jgi:DNA excision repair protein ERCC-4